MSTKIRLARGGAKKRPYYRIVVANADAPRDGAFLEKVGTYNPLLEHNDPLRIVLRQDRIEYWLGCGAKPTDRVANFLAQSGITLPKAIQKAIEIKAKSRTVKLPKSKKE